MASENVVGYNHVNETTDNKERCLVKAKAQGASANFLARLEKLLHIGHTHGAHHVLDSPAVRTERSMENPIVYTLSFLTPLEV